LSKLGFPPIDKGGISAIHASSRTSNGVHVQLRTDPKGVIESPELDAVLIAIHVGTAARVSCQRGGEKHSGSAVHGDIDIMPANTSARWEVHDQADTVLLIGLPVAYLNVVVEEDDVDPGRIEVRNRFQIRDPQLERIGWAMKSEVQFGSPSGRLFMDGLALSAAARLLSAHYSLSVPEEGQGKLTGRSLKAVLEYIEEHLAEDLSLGLLAQIAGRSQSHFRSLFRASLGVPVHQYVIQRRVERAKMLIMTGRRSLAEIASASGFANQSHLTRHLRRQSGLSPAKMRQVSG